MMLDLPAILRKHNLSIKGVIHVGAHEGGETQYYVKSKIHDVILIEANPSRFQNLQESIRVGRYCTWCTPLQYAFFSEEEKKILRNYETYNYAVTDKDDSSIYLHTTNFDGGADSIFQINSHGSSTSWCGYQNISSVKVKTMTLDSLIQNKERFNFLNIDVEGAEALVLKGAKQLLSNNIEFIMLEYQDEPRFDGSCVHSEIQEFLSGYNFKCVEIFDTGKKWGDAFYVKY